MTELAVESLPMRTVSARALILICAIVLIMAGQQAVSADAPSIWSADSIGRQVVVTDGRTVLTPALTAWSSADALAREPLLFWHSRGIRIEATLTLSAIGKDSDQGVTGFIGLTSATAPQPLQSADNVVGLFLRRTQDGVEAWLGRKEAQSPTTAARGDQWGNVPSVSKPLTLRGNTPTAIVLTLNDRKIEATIGDEKLLIDSAQLTQSTWQRTARLAVSLRNPQVGRGSLTVERLSIDCPRLDESLFQCVDLRPYANVGFTDDIADDKQGGWTDQGNNDLRWLPTGRQMFGSIPFDVINPARNDGKDAVLLYSTKREGLPKQIGPIAVDRTVNSVIFFHTAAWANKEGVTAAHYRVQYGDGQVTQIPVVTSRQIDDWWSLRQPADSAACLAMQVKSDNSGRGLVGLYAYRWTNPRPGQSIKSIRLVSGEGEPTVGVLAITLVNDSIGDAEQQLLQAAFAHDDEIDARKNPPDRDQIPDRIVLKQPKALQATAFSAGGNYNGGKGGTEALLQPAFAEEVRQIGGILRYPHGLEINFAFWPYEIQDWYPTFMDKGGRYGAIMQWVNKGKGRAPEVISLKTMLEVCRKQGFKLILQLNCTAMFDGRDFIYIKTLPEDRMRKESPLASGKFDETNLARIVARNAELVDYVLLNGYRDTIAYWEMDNERWDMPGAEYAAAVAAHVKMLRSKIPDAKTIVCIDTMGSYCPNIDGSHFAIWDREVLSTLQKLGMNDQIDCFAPHEYPFLKDKAGEIVPNYLQDWCIRNVYRDLDYAARQLDTYGFGKAMLYATEWGFQSDIACCEESRNDLNTSMAAAIAAGKTMMALYSHPRTAGATLHPFLHASMVDAEQKVPLSKWGEQTLFFTRTGRQITTPPLEAVKMFIAFAADTTLVPTSIELPRGVNCLAAQDQKGLRYFVVNSTAFPVSFPAKISRRSSLFSKSVLDSSILAYGSYGEAPSDVREIVPLDFTDNVLPPFSVSILR
jgi:hypothetical protein